MLSWFRWHIGHDNMEQARECLTHDTENSGGFRFAVQSISELQAWCRKRNWMNERAPKGVSYEPTNLEHCANTLSHGVMIIPSILGGELLLRCASLHHGRLSTDNCTLSDGASMFSFEPTGLHYEISARVYGASLVGLFLVSTIFHWLTWSKTDHPTKDIGLSDNCCGSQLWEFFHLCDRAVIFTFISGSYTPWLMLNDVHPSLEWLRWGMWVFVMLGILYSCVLLEKYKLLETILYVALGLLPGLALATTSEGTSMKALSLGGFFYLSGVLVFKSDGWIPCAHAIWHLFVAAGAISHYFACYTILYTI